MEEKSRFTIREFDPQGPNSSADWQAIQKLLAETPLATGADISIFRAGDYHQAFPTLHSHPRRILLAETAGTVIGILGFEIQNIWHNQQTSRSLYLADGRIRRDFQGRGVIGELLEYLKPIAKQENISHGYFLVTENNNSILRLLQKWKSMKIEKMTNSRFLVGAVLLPPPAQTEKFVPFTPDTRAFKRYCEKLSACFWAPQYEISKFESLAKNNSTLTFFADPRSPNEIAFALWDQHSFKKISKKFTAKESILRKAWNFAAPLLKAPLFPESEQAWRQMEICFVDPSLVKDERIPSFAYSWAHKHKSHFISFYSLQHLGRGFYKTGFLGSQLKWNTGIDF
ncbi:MAG: N-acetyltransferase family protein, partial [Pseudobdellovibrionaceae bacterium]